MAAFFLGWPFFLWHVEPLDQYHVSPGEVALIRLRIGQHLQDASRKMFVDFGVSRERLGHFRDGVVIPIVLSALANEQTPTGFKLTNEVFALHRSVSSASLRTPGIWPLVRS